MKPNPRRIAIATAIMAGIASALVLMPIWSPRHRTGAFEFKTWIPIPMGMDAPQGWTTQRLLNWYIGRLADRCTSSSMGSGPTEEYSMAVSTDGFTSIDWQMDLVPSGDTMNVAVRTLSSRPRPLQSPPSSSLSSPEIRQKSLKDMQPIREALMNPDLWSTPEDTPPFICRAPRQVTLEACVRGHYFARVPQHCSNDRLDKAVWKLDDLLLHRFAPPTAGL